MSANRSKNSEREYTLLSSVDLLEINYTRPFNPISGNVSRYILVDVNHFSQYVFTEPVATATTEVSWWFIENSISKNFEWPAVVYADSGLYFAEDAFSKRLKT